MNTRFAILLLISVLAVSIVPLSPVPRALASSSIPDPCGSTATSAAGVHFICPQGDGDALGAAGLTITVTVRDFAQAPVPGIPAQDIWLIGCSDLLVLCGGSGAINATAPTDANGMTTIEGDIAGGGCDPGVRVVVQGIVIGGGVCSGGCLPIQVRSPDQKGTSGPAPDLQVTASDFAYFGTSYESPPKPYFACHDYVGYGTITVADFAKFGAHFEHLC